MPVRTPSCRGVPPRLAITGPTSEMSARTHMYIRVGAYTQAQLTGAAQQAVDDGERDDGRAVALADGKRAAEEQRARERGEHDHVHGAEAVREHFRGLDLGPIVTAFDGRVTVTTGEQVTAAEFLASLPELEDDTWDQVAARLGATSEGQRASATELALEGLFLARRLAKDSGDGETIYG